MHRITNSPPRLPIDAKEARASETETPAGKPAPANAAAQSPSPADEATSTQPAARSELRIRQANLGRSALGRIISGYEKISASEQAAKAGAARPRLTAGKQALTAPIDRLLEQRHAIPIRWEPDCGPLPGMPDIDWNSIKPTGDLLGADGSGCVVGLQANRLGPTAQQDGNGLGKHVQLAAKFIFDEHGMPGQAAGNAGAPDRLQQELSAYRSIIEAQPRGKALGGHPNLREIYGIVSMKVDGAEMRALLMEAVPGHDARKTADILRRCRDAGYFSERQYWGAIQYLCDRTLDATEHLKQAGIMHGDLKQHNILVREDGAVKAIYPGLATGAAAAGPAEGDGRKSSAAATGRVVKAPVKQLAAAYSDFVKSVSAKIGARLPVLPGEARQMDFVKDPMMGHEEAQAVIRAAFNLAEIEGKRNGGMDMRAQKPEKAISRFLEKPDLENYLGLKKHYLHTHDQEKVIAGILNSMPPGALQALNDALSSSFAGRGERLYEKGSWISGFKADDRSGPEQESIDRLRGYLDDASRLFKELKAVSHPLTPVDWPRFKDVGALTKTALRLMSEHAGIRQAMPSPGTRDNHPSS